MQIKQALDWGAEALRAAGRDNPRLDSQVLLASALGMSKERLYTEAGREVASDRLSLFEGMVRRRAGGEPVQYITGTREFMSLDFAVRPGVLIPRPETEILVEVALELLRERAVSLSAPVAGDKQMGASTHAPATTQERTATTTSAADEARTGVHLTVADIGTGSGAIAVALAVHAQKPTSALPSGLALRVVATDVSSEALSIARENADKNGVVGSVDFLAGDLMQPLERERFIAALDGIVSNPPYIPTLELATLPDEVREFEPAGALDGGPDGLVFYRRLVSAAPRYLKPGGFLAIEVGAGQAEEVLSMLLANGFVRCSIQNDLAGIGRVVSGVRGRDRSALVD